MAASEPSYTVRATAFTPAKTYRLAHDGLAMLPALLRWVKRGQYDPHAIPAGRLPAEPGADVPGGGS